MKINTNIPRFIFLTEIIIGMIGFLQFLAGLLFFWILPSAIPPVILGFIGFKKYFTLYGLAPSSQKSRTRIIEHFIVLTLLASAIIVFPHPGIAGLEYKVPVIATVLWPFYNVFVLSPFFLKSFIVLLLYAHLLFVALDRSTKEAVKPTAFGLMRASLILPVVLVIINVIFY